MPILLLLLACSGSDDPTPATTDSSPTDTGTAPTPILVVTYNTGTTEGLAHDAEPDDGYSSDDAYLSDTWYGDGLAWNPAVDPATTFFARVRPDIVGFQEIFFSDDCATIPEEAHGNFVCTTWMPGDPTVANTILGPDYQVACHPGKSDKCLAVRKDFGTFTGCSEDFCLEGLDGGEIEGCGSGSRVARGVVERTDGSTVTVHADHHPPRAGRPDAQVVPELDGVDVRQLHPGAPQQAPVHQLLVVQRHPAEHPEAEEGQGEPQAGPQQGEPQRGAIEEDPTAADAAQQPAHDDHAGKQQLQADVGSEHLHIPSVPQLLKGYTLRRSLPGDEMPYEPPEVWTWNTESGGRFASINRPVAGPTHESELPVGEHPFQLYSLATPNGVKVTVLFEELLEAGHDAEYDAWPIDILKGDQFSSGYVAANPNSKIPVLMDHRTDPPTRVFESGAILLHLAESFGAFLPTEPRARTEALCWLFWQMGSAPYLGGGFGHFYAYAPEKIEYAVDRFAMEAKRQLSVLDRHLAEHTYMAGAEYSIADMAIWPWYGALARGLLYEAATFLSVHEYEHVRRWADAINDRPAVQRGIRVNRTWGDADKQLPERHSAADFRKD